MKSNKVWILVVALAAAGTAPLGAADKRSDAKDKADVGKASKAIVLEGQKLEEAEAKNKLEEPNFGYVGVLGSFQVTKKLPTSGMPIGQIVVHHFPHQDQIALGQTKLKYVGAKRLGNVDGWVFETEWDGKHYPSKIFFSAEKVYFGGGVSDYIAADFRTESGWVWKYHPLRRMELLGKTTSAE